MLMSSLMKKEHGMNVAMLVEKITDSTTCGAKNKSNCANVLFP